MKKSKIIVPALGILVLSTAAAVTGTVAWFTSSNLLNVNGMYARVDAENGIVVSNEAKSNWATSAQASHSGEEKDFMLTSTADLSAWYHNNSNDANSAAAAKAYETLTVNKPDAGTVAANTGLGTTTYNELAKNVYLINRFYIQSASGVALTTQDINVKNIAVSGNSTSAELDKALRIAFKYGNTVAIYGGLTGFTASYKVNGSTTATTAKAPDVVTKLADNVTIPAFTAAGTSALEIEVYAYFEGEDAAAKSANITAKLDELAISFQFENANHQA